MSGVWLCRQGGWLSGGMCFEWAAPFAGRGAIGCQTKRVRRGLYPAEFVSYEAYCDLFHDFSRH